MDTSFNKGNFESKIWKIKKIWERSENFHFQRGGLPYFGVVRKFSFSRGLINGGRGGFPRGFPLSILQHRKGQPSFGGRGSSLKCSGEHTFVERGIGGSSPLYGWRIKNIGLHRGGVPPCSPPLWETLTIMKK